MDSVWIQAVASGLFGIAGVIAGIIISERLAIRREERQRDQDRVAIRALLRIEADSNLERLKDFVSRVATARDIAPLPDSDTVAALCFVQESMPTWSNVMWQSQAAQLPIALDNEEIVLLHKLYDDLAGISDIWRRLEAMLEADDAAVAAARPEERKDVRRDFVDRGGRLWREAEEIMSRALQRGNPLNQVRLPGR